jgi:hypothetical protein
MRYPSCAFTLLLICVSATGQTGTKSSAGLQSVAHLFDYDTKQPLMSMTRSSKSSRKLLCMILLTLAQRAALSLRIWLSPKERVRLPAIGVTAPAQNSFLKGSCTGRSERFLLFPDYPWDRPQPWRKTPDHFDKPELDRETEIQAVVDLRRGIHLLLARTDVDPKRLAYCRTQLWCAMGIHPLCSRQTHEDIGAHGRSGRDTGHLATR